MRTRAAGGVHSQETVRLSFCGIDQTEQVRIDILGKVIGLSF